MQKSLERLKGVFLATGFAVWSVALVGASCDKKSSADPSAPGPQVGPPAVAEELPGVDVSKLGEEQRQRFYRLVDKVQSPCGKAHSLRTSIKTDPSCKRATFAGRYLVRRLGDDLADNEIVEKYEARYLDAKRHEFDLKSSPYLGAPDAPIVLVEFFDYGCPHCKMFGPVLEDVQAEFPSDVVIYFKHFPLSGHPDSIPAAMAAVAAQKQGRFREMHKKLFENQERHGKEDLLKYARDIGLDLGRFAADLEDDKTREKVMKDREEGEKADLMGTPTLYVNGRMFSDDLVYEEIVDWIKEEIAVNR